MSNTNWCREMVSVSRTSPSFWLWQKQLQPQDLHTKQASLRVNAQHERYVYIWDIRQWNRENAIPKSMLAEFCKLVGTWKRTIPAIDRGILFSDPTKLWNCIKQKMSLPQKQEQSLELHFTGKFLTCML